MISYAIELPLPELIRGLELEALTCLLTPKAREDYRICIPKELWWTTA